MEKQHDSDDLKYWLALSLIDDVGPVTARRLLSAFRSPKKILEAKIAELRGVENISEAKAKKIAGFDSWDAVEKAIVTAKEYGIRIIKYTDGEYPENLRQIEDSPVLLYCKGRLEKEDRYAIAIVGSRNMTPYGQKIAESIASGLASYGLTIVSGMARGIDTCSHKGALKAKGRSIAVLGNGLDNPYPPENAALFDELSNNGCVISEFPPGTPPNRENFPQRNRLISGLSLGVLVVEATVKSGSLITAGHALEQGKEIFAVPGSITSGNSEGTNALIKKGAKLVQKADDILEELAPQIKGLLKGSHRDVSEKNLLVNISGLEITGEEKAICNILGSEPRHVDEIARETRIPSAKLLGLLLTLELKGIIKQAEGKRFHMA
ncbi:MAG: DNA protecting protein DprA [Nitrospirae bacterium GWB2_47_37]|nr:MAG: DNA protecting protein DprA [Nitrospirae bacterium GWB2_47_37]HAK88932.1 DNA-protecting protein DprA [Nitrospiraceae bacterium]